ncbi:hypothetical protein T439DRAFT_324755 [Meredithblackwellia eburnea MCA 4105]
MDLEGGLGNLTSPLIAGLAGKEVDTAECRLLGAFAIGIQLLMGVIVLGSLLLKRYREKPRRKWRVWLGDVSKQVLGQAFVHASNVAISDLIAHHQNDNPCSLYALNIFVDTTVGVLILYFFLKIFTSILQHYQPADFQTGNYGNPFQTRIWAKQAVVYVAALFCMKIVVVGLFWAIPALFVAANWCLSWLESDDAQVVFVMLIFPLVMNLIQFLTIDSILKSSNLASPITDDDDEARRALFEDTAGSDDEDEDPDRLRAKSPGPKDGRSLTPEPFSDASSFQSALKDDDKLGGIGRTSVRPVDFVSGGEGSSSGGTTPTGRLAAGSHSYPPVHTPSTTPGSTPRQTPSSALDSPTPKAASKRMSYGTSRTAPPPSYSVGEKVVTPLEKEVLEEPAERSSFEDNWGLSEDEISLSGAEKEENLEVDLPPLRSVVA